MGKRKTMKIWVAEYLKKSSSCEYSLPSYPDKKG